MNSIIQRCVVAALLAIFSVARKTIRALALHDSSQLLTANGAAMIVESGPGEFLIVGSGLTVTFLRDPDTDDQIAGIAGIEQVTGADGRWVTELRLNGDQSDQGRALLMDSHAFRIYRVKLLTYARH